MATYYKFRCTYDGAGRYGVGDTTYKYGDVFILSEADVKRFINSNDFAKGYLDHMGEVESMEGQVYSSTCQTNTTALNADEPMWKWGCPENYSTTNQSFPKSYERSTSKPVKRLPAPTEDDYSEQERLEIQERGTCKACVTKPKKEKVVPELDTPVSDGRRVVTVHLTQPDEWRTMLVDKDYNELDDAGTMSCSSRDEALIDHDQMVHMYREDGILPMLEYYLASKHGGGLKCGSSMN